MRRRKSENLMALELPWSTEDDLRAQHEYVERNRNFDFNLLVADAFLKGMRSVGYRSTSTALDELLDNAIQAGATRIRVVFDGEKPGPDSIVRPTRKNTKRGATTALQKKPTFLAVIDNGHGMEPEMIRHAMVWGGTHRSDDRRGFGRFGFGLPTASISQGRKYTVYSRLDREPFSGISLDTETIGVYTGAKGGFEMPAARELDIPPAIDDVIKSNFDDFSHGTIVLIEKLDNLSWDTAQELERHLVEHFGVYYRNVLPGLELFVNDQRVDPVDPLFLTEGARYYDLDSDRAEAYPEITIPVKDAKTDTIQGIMRVRISYLSPSFSKEVGAKDQPTGKTNARYPILREYNHGIIICRNGRQVDIVKPKWRNSTITRDNYWGVEIDFPATLDEEFSIQTTKQGVSISRRIWTLLEEYNVRATIDAINNRGLKERRERHLRAQDDPSIQRPSEVAISSAVELRGHKPTPTSAESEREAKQNLDRQVRQEVEKEQISEVEARKRAAERAARRPFELRIESAKEGPFYRVQPHGQQKLIFLNSDHAFYTRLYAAPQSTPYIRSALEVLLFALADAELNANDNLLRIYRNERQIWSRLLRDALETLAESDPDAFGEVLSESA